MSKSRNPIELVDRYLQAVRFWMPKNQRQEELMAELGEDLRSQVEEKETELGHALDATEVSAILKRCGSPMVVASRLGPKRHLIGPTLYPIYTFVLRMVLLWILVPVFIFIVGPVNLANSGGDWASALGNTIGDLWSGLFIAAGVITLVFAILERSHAHDAMACNWDPLSLPPVRKQEKKPSLVQTVCEMAFNFFGLIWLLLLPHYSALILGPARKFLTPGPIWHTFYVPIILLAVFALLRPGVTLAKPQWTWFPPFAQLLQTVFSLIILNYMLNAASQAPNGQWHPFVVLTEPARNSAQYIRVAATVNVSILIGLASAWLGLCIAAIVHSWQLVRYIRNRISGAQQPASMQAQ